LNSADMIKTKTQRKSDTNNSGPKICFIPKPPG
jgi:hypothetical protein